MYGLIPEGQLRESPGPEEGRIKGDVAQDEISQGIGERLKRIDRWIPYGFGVRLISSRGRRLDVD